MSDLLNPPCNPKELASARAEQISATSDNFEATNNDEFMLTELDYAAEELGFIGQNYFFSAFRGFVFPKQFDATKPVTYHSIFDITAEGPFAAYSRVSVGRLIGVGTVRAVCLTFDEATILPSFTKLENDEMLFVPVLSIDSMTTVD